MTLRVLYGAQHHRQHCALLAFEQFGALYKHNLDDKHGTPLATTGSSSVKAGGISVHTLPPC